MQRDDAIKILTHIRNVEPDAMIMVAYDMAIEALEQDPLEVEAAQLQKVYNKGFEDCRQAVLEKTVYTETEEGWCGYTVDVDYIKSLPSVKQEPKTGHWIRINPAGIYECSECGQNVMTSNICVYKFCHGCGARMVEPQERE